MKSFLLLFFLGFISLNLEAAVEATCGIKKLDSLPLDILKLSADPKFYESKDIAGKVVSKNFNIGANLFKDGIYLHFNCVAVDSSVSLDSINKFVNCQMTLETSNDQILGISAIRVLPDTSFGLSVITVDAIVATCFVETSK